MRLAIEMPEIERQRRMQKMRGVVADNNIYRWVGKILTELLRFEFPEDSQDFCAEQETGAAAF